MEGMNYVLEKLDRLESELERERQARAEAEERVEDLEGLVGTHIGSTDPLCAVQYVHGGRMSRLEEELDLEEYESLPDEEKQSYEAGEV